MLQNRRLFSCSRFALSLSSRHWAVGLAVLVLGAAACEREVRPFQDVSAASARSQKPVLTGLYAGTAAPPAEESPFQGNAYGTGEGKHLFDQYNCSGCHSHGGGGMGPPLMDDKWIYGNRPANIFDTIIEGRPNGMPSFRNKIPDAQVWQLVAYVQSMSGQQPIDVLPSRSDHMRYSTPENARSAQTPVLTGRP
jgi:cytochrome c oxidase cbb3-type subunit III